jgi:hypothetical protein
MLPVRLLLRFRSFLARSWWLSSGLYRLHGLPLIGPPHEEVWYFAYGANMHDNAFRGWRGMRPLDWRPGRVRGYRLRFNLEGRPKGRAAPANLFPPTRRRRSGVSSTSLPGATSFVWTPRKASRGARTGRCGWRPRTSAATRFGR